jgi:hypothetical protein
MSYKVTLFVVSLLITHSAKKKAAMMTTSAGRLWLLDFWVCPLLLVIEQWCG